MCIFQVLSAVLQRLTEEPEIPVLMMRTVLQALTLYPNLGPLVLNILQLLIEKEVSNAQHIAYNYSFYFWCKNVLVNSAQSNERMGWGRRGI